MYKINLEQYYLRVAWWTVECVEAKDGIISVHFDSSSICPVPQTTLLQTRTIEYPTYSWQPISPTFRLLHQVSDVHDYSACHAMIYDYSAIVRKKHRKSKRVRGNNAFTAADNILPHQTNTEGESQHHIPHSLPKVSRSNEFATSNDVKKMCSQRR